VPLFFFRGRGVAHRVIAGGFQTFTIAINNVALGGSSVSTMTMLATASAHGSENYQLQYAFNEGVYIYAFNSKIYDLAITGVGFMADCSTPFAPNVGPRTGIDYVQAQYEQLKLTKTGRLVLIHLGDQIYRAALVDFHTELTDVDTGIGQWGIKAVAVPTIIAPPPPSFIPGNA
jgi:hypothetical protein